MFEEILALINQVPLLGQIMLVIVAMNVALTGVARGLELIQDKTATQVDNKIVAFLNKVTGFVQKIVDAIGFNPQHKK